MSKDVKTRFWNFVTNGKPNDCWPWQGHINKKGGYGYISYMGTPTPAHRVSYELHKGLIPDGLVIDHSCNNKICVNPNHLEACEHIVNINRGFEYHRIKTSEFFVDSAGNALPVYLSRNGKPYVFKHSSKGNKYMQALMLRKGAGQKYKNYDMKDKKANPNYKP